MGCCFSHSFLGAKQLFGGNIRNYEVVDDRRATNNIPQIPVPQQNKSNYGSNNDENYQPPRRPKLVHSTSLRFSQTQAVPVQDLPNTARLTRTGSVPTFLANLNKENRIPLLQQVQAKYATANPVDSLPIAVDLPRLINNTEVKDEHGILFEKPSSNPTPQGRETLLKNFIFALMAKLPTKIDQESNSARYDDIVLQHMESDLPPRLKEFLKTLASENNPVINLLKVINQALIATAVTKVKMYFMGHFVLKDVRNGWDVSVAFGAENIVVSHIKWEETMPAAFKLCWQLDYVFDKASWELVDAKLHVVKLEFTTLTDLDEQESVQELVEGFAAKISSQPQMNAALKLFTKVASPAPLSRFGRSRYSTVAKPKLRVLVSASQDILFNLATEEWIFNEMDPSYHTLFLWRNDKTVIIGRYQNPWKECHLQRMEQDGVVLARRKSGGGAVYQDLGNSCFTFLTSRKDYDIPRNTSIIVNALKHFDITAEPTGRNDITVGGRKVSGSAFKLTHDRAFHHGTLLMDVDLNALERYLNPNKEKLKSKGVASVKARVVNMKELNNEISHETVVPQLIKSFFHTYDSSCEVRRVPFMAAWTDMCQTEYLDTKQLEQISSLNKYYEEYKDWNWRYGKTPDFTHSLEHRFDWGIMDVNFEASGGKITDVKVFSDSLYPQMIEEVQASLKGAAYDQRGVSAAIDCAKLKLAGTGTEPHLDQFKEWLVKNI